MLVDLHFQKETAVEQKYIDVIMTSQFIQNAEHFNNGTNWNFSSHIQMHCAVFCTSDTVNKNLR